MNDRLKRLTDDAIKFIQNAEKLALRMDERGFHVAFSGGKDSQVLLALVEMSGCKHHAEMQVTSVDSPNLMRFVRQHYPQVKLNLPKRNMRELILGKGMLPTRQARYCCAELKEKAGAGCCTAIGIRKAESTNRAKRHAVEIIGQRIGYDIVDGKLYEQQATWGGQLFDNEKQCNVYCVGGKDKVTVSQYLNGLIRIFGILSRETICHIVICMIRAFIGLAAYSALWLHPKKSNVNYPCFPGLPKRFTSVPSMN